MYQILRYNGMGGSRRRFGLITLTGSEWNTTDGRVLIEL
jgi:hypothetical protein